MSLPVVCDQLDCPAAALHHVELYGQDFHFCGHHWAEHQPALLAQPCQPEVREMRPPSRERTVSPLPVGYPTLG